MSILLRRLLGRDAGNDAGAVAGRALDSVLCTIIALAGVFAVGIGLLFTFPYAFAATASLYGQYAQRTQGAAGVAPAV